MRISKPSFKAILLTTVAMIFLSSVTVLLSRQQTNAAAPWNPEEIIDNAVLTNKNTMSVAQIQDFLNSKVPVCDTQGTQTSEYGGGTRAQWAANASYHPAEGAFYPPFTCLKDYTENGLSSAQIIYNAAQQYSINPQVLIVLLQKEQGLVTDTWPAPIQYQSATGYGCPDSSPGVCSSQYYGFTNQINWAATMFHAIMVDSPTWSKKYYPYWATDPNTGTTGARYVYYKPTTSCGGSWLNIQNRATQALYNYTPYQPNQAAIDAAMGQTVNCGAYGNINFYRYFTSWFGSTTNPDLNFSVIQGPNSSALYLQTSAGKYYLPSHTIMQAWGIDSLPVQQVSQAYIDNLTTGPSLSNLLKDDWNNYFLVENGTLHYVRDLSYLSLWNISPSNAVQSLGLAYTLPSGSWLGRFVQDSSQPTGSYWLIDKGQKHLINDSSLLYQWRYTPDQLTTISAAFLNSIPTNSNNITPYATDGSTSYVIDSGTKLSLSNANIQNAYYGSQSPVPYDPITLSFLPNRVADQFAIDTSNGQWFMLEGAKKHYIPSANLAQLWGKTTNTDLTTLSDQYLSSIQTGGNLSYVIQTASPSAYWLVDGQRHLLADTNTINAWTTVGQTPPTYSTQSLNTLTQGGNATTTIHAVGSPYYYLMDAGIKHYLMSSGSLSGWGTTVTNTNSSLVSMIPETSFLNYVAKSSDGHAYLLMNNLSYLIDPVYYNDWGIGSGTPVVDSSTISRYASSNLTLRAYIQIGSTLYVMQNGNKIPIIANADAYQSASLQQTTLPSDYFPTSNAAAYLANSTNTQDSSVWLISSGKKYLFSNFATYVSYGYLSRGVALTALTPESLALIPTASDTPGLFIRTAGSYGVKFVNFGTSLGFPDGDTLSNLIGSTPILVVSDSVYNSFPLVGLVSRILKDDAGKIYLVENGQKRWITNSTAYDPYRNYPVTYLYGTTMSLIPDGPAIN
jgi:hypothetical protein